jgi:hypothetical protein
MLIHISLHTVHPHSARTYREHILEIGVPFHTWLLAVLLTPHTLHLTSFMHDTFQWQGVQSVGRNSQPCTRRLQHTRLPRRNVQSSVADRRDILVLIGCCRCPIRAQTDNSTGAGRAFTSMLGNVAYKLAILLTLRGEGSSEDRHSPPA